jgi:hypothetical protein
MNRRSILSISAIAALGLAVLPSSAVAQQKQQVSFKTLLKTANTRNNKIST